MRCCTPAKPQSNLLTSQLKFDGILDAQVTFHCSRSGNWRLKAISCILTPEMPHALAYLLSLFTTVLAVAGMGYFVAALLAARLFLAERRAMLATFAPGVSVLKSLKGLDPGMIEAFRSHCRQSYQGEYELLFGVASLADPAVEAVHQLQAEFPERAIRLIECPRRLGTNGKVSTLVQLAAHARFDYLLINDSDITVSPRYLERVMGCFAPEAGPKVGLVTALYRGRAHGTLPSRLEALGIADFQANVLLVEVDRGRPALRPRLHAGREPRGAGQDRRPAGIGRSSGRRLRTGRARGQGRISRCVERGGGGDERAGLRLARFCRPSVALGADGARCAPRRLRGPALHARAEPWRLLNVLASGASLLSLWLLGLSFCLRMALAMTVGAEVLGDRQTLPGLWLLPLRDLIAMGLWAAGYAGSTIVWRGER